MFFSTSDVYLVRILFKIKSDSTLKSKYQFEKSEIVDRIVVKFREYALTRLKISSFLP